jgi:hypothetical protein
VRVFIQQNDSITSIHSCSNISLREESANFSLTLLNFLLVLSLSIESLGFTGAP